MSESDFLCEEPPAYGAGGKPSPVLEYLRKLERALKRGDSTEHTHRPALKELLEALMETKRLMAEIDASIKQHGGWPLK